MGSNREYLRIPRDATFPALPLPETLGEYAHGYYLAANCRSSVLCPRELAT